METFEFKKNLQERFEEIESILSYENEKIPAAQVRREWKHFVEVAIEPTGWQALWRIPRVTCEELNVKFPTVVFGFVEQVLFDELKATFRVIAVQDDDVPLPDMHEVPLEELWPTKAQENSAINIDMTAECVDRVRFFYNHIWMPWDNDSDEETDWVEKNLQSRIQFYCDLKNKTINPSLTTHILMLLSEARYIQKRRDYLELDLSDVEDVNMENKEATDVMCLNLRLHMIKNEIEMLENPQMRTIYQLVNFPNKFGSCNKIDQMNYFTADRNGNEPPTSTYKNVVVSGIGPLKRQIEYMNDVKVNVPDDEVISMCSSLQQALYSGNVANNIYIPHGRHSIKFLEYLNSGGSIRSVYKPNLEKKDDLDEEHNAIIESKNDDSILLTFDGDYTLENIVLNCSNVRTGILIRNGNIVLKNCVIAGDPNSSTKLGIVMSGDSSILCEGCVIQNFATGIYSDNESKVVLKNTTIDNCVNGIELFNKGDVNLESVIISNSKKFGIWFETNDFISDTKKTIHKSFTEVEDFKDISGSCEFKDNAAGNFVIVNNKHSVFNSSCFHFDDDNSDAELDFKKNGNSIISINDSDISITNGLVNNVPIDVDSSFVEVD